MGPDMPMPRLLGDVFAADGTISTGSVAAVLHITKAELAETIGVSSQAVGKTRRATSPATQARLRDMIQIITRVMPWSGSAAQAFAWYRAQPLPSFGDLTAEDLVKQGRGDAVRLYLSRIAEGGYA
jgi:hypothetical protein